VPSLTSQDAFAVLIRMLRIENLDLPSVQSRRIVMYTEFINSCLSTLSRRYMDIYYVDLENMVKSNRVVLFAR
jgi:hypothetical protein